MTSPLTELFAALASVFRQAALRWYLIGAQAAAFYGVARLTADVDLTVLLDDYSLDDLLSLLREAGFESRGENLHAFVRQTRVLPVVYRQTSMPVDIVIGGPGLEERFANAARICDLDGVQVPVARSEDLVVMKLLAGREKDMQDISAILQMRSTRMNMDDVRATLAGLETALGRSDLIPALARLGGDAADKGYEPECGFGG